MKPPHHQQQCRMKRKCPVCKNEYDDGGDSWKKKCYDCYKNYRSSNRISSLGYKSIVYVTHPSVTKEELDQYIVEKKLERGWGVEELNVKNYGEKYRIWFDSTNFD
mgnify:CR=1 FL=1